MYMSHICVTYICVCIYVTIRMFCNREGVTTFERDFKKDLGLRAVDIFGISDF